MRLIGSSGLSFISDYLFENNRLPNFNGFNPLLGGKVA